MKNIFEVTSLTRWRQPSPLRLAFLNIMNNIKSTMLNNAINYKKEECMVVVEMKKDGAMGRSTRPN